jgi:hypothetical protein
MPFFAFADQRQHIFFAYKIFCSGLQHVGFLRQCSDWIFLYLHFSSIRLIACTLPKFDVFASSARFLDRFLEPKPFRRPETMRRLIIFQPARVDACQLFTKNCRYFLQYFRHSLRRSVGKLSKIPYI